MSNRHTLDEARRRLQDATDGCEMMGETFVIHLKPCILDRLTLCNAERELEQIGLLLGDLIQNTGTHIKAFTLNPDKSSATLLLGAKNPDDVRYGYQAIQDELGTLPALEEEFAKAHPRINPSQVAKLRS